MNPPLERLYRALGHRFSAPDLVTCALTHRSAGNCNNERLEFLGDAVLGFVIAEALYRSFPEANEGQLSRLRASLVKRDSLADVARGLGLGDYLVLGSGELKSGGQARDSILADALEAIFGAVFLDGELDICRRVILSVFRQRLDAVSLRSMNKDPKTRLQEYLQSRRLPLPDYQVLEISGVAHAQAFKVKCEIEGLDESIWGTGSSRRRAEQDAADQALRRLRHE